MSTEKQETTILQEEITKLAAGGEEGVHVVKKGGVQEVQKADVRVVKEQAAAALEREREIEKQALEQLQRAKDEAEAHRKLAQDAEQLITQKQQESAQEAEQVEQLSKRVEELKLKEAEIGMYLK